MTRRAFLPSVLAALGAAALVAAVAFLQRGAADGRGAPARLVAELVNDHLRVLAAARPVELESSDARVVEPWLAERLDFAPVVPAAAGTGLRLRGGSIGYVLDRKSAVVVYGLRLHQLTLLAFRATGLAWPAASPDRAPPALERSSERGFHAVLWRTGDLGYALVSDSNSEELADLAKRLAGATAEEAGG